MGRIRVFLGSAREHLEIVEALQVLNEHSQVELRPWTDFGFFDKSGMPLDSLLEKLPEYSGAAFLAFGLDRTNWKDTEVIEPRDNVLFEAGIANGIFGRQRTVLVVNSEAKLPSDISGMTTMKFKPGVHDPNDLHKQLEKHFLSVLTDTADAPSLPLSFARPERFPQLTWERLGESFPEVKRAAVQQAIALTESGDYAKALTTISGEKHIVASYLRARLALLTRDQTAMRQTSEQLLAEATQQIVRDNRRDAYFFFEIAARRLVKLFSKDSIALVRRHAAELSAVYEPIDLHHLRGLTELADGKYEAALNHYDMGIARGTDHAWTFVDKAECLWKLGRQEVMS